MLSIFHVSIVLFCVLCFRPNAEIQSCVALLKLWRFYLFCAVESNRPKR